MEHETKQKKVKHQTRIITPSKYSSAISQVYGFYEVGKTLIITFITKPL